MHALHRKLLRDLAALRGQAAAIAVVIAGGVMTLIIAVTTLDTIAESRDRFYRENDFAEVFATLKRAPEGVADRINAIPGVNLVETRVTAAVRIEVPEFGDPVRGQLISLPDGRQPRVNRLHLREGTLPLPLSRDGAVISEPFAEAHDLHAGDRLAAIINGRLETLTVSGVALSPEWIYQIGPADLMPDYERFAVLWMNRRALANALDMDGAFNDVALTLQAGASAEPVIDALDRILERYGALGARDREQQTSHRFLSEELRQLRTMAVALPAIFLTVSAFLLNMLVGRIVRTQRQQIALLKAFGYRNHELALHYGLLTAAIVAMGSALGVAFGAWAADALTGVYTEYFRFPDMRLRLQPWVVALGVSVAAAAAALGSFRAVRSAVVLAPAVAMRPPAPERFRRGRFATTRLAGWLDQSTRIILRNLARHRVQAGLSVTGVALSAALMLVGSYQFGAVDHLIDVQYRLVQKMDVVLSFTEPTPARAVGELRHEPGVLHVEPFRAVPARLHSATRDYRIAVQGMDARPRLRGLIDRHGATMALPAEGLVMTDHLADYLRVQPGERLILETLEGRRRTIPITLAATVSEPVGLGAYMERRALNRVMREGPAISGAWLLIDESRQDALTASLWEIPRIAGIGLVAQAEGEIRRYIADTVLIMMGVLLLLAGSITFAVVYNNARIAFAERGRELATLRVLGFTRGETAWIVIGEVALLTLLAIPLGWVLGAILAWLLTTAMSTELFRVPFIISRQALAFSALGVGLAFSMSIALVVQRLRAMDMLTALKTAE